MNNTGEGRKNIPRGSKWSRIGPVLLAAAFCFLAINGLWIEPNDVQVTHWTIRNRLHPPLKIAELTDLHVMHFGWRERDVVRILKRERPDVVVITGDSVGEGLHYDRVHRVLSAIVATRPPLGVWLVRGNWENWHPLRNEREFYKSAGVHFLLNQGALIRPGVWLAGLDDPSSGHPELEQAMQGAPLGAYVIALFHAPAYFDVTAGRYDLALAGHTHGGQVNLPLIRPFWLPRGSGRFLEGWYRERDSRMYVSRGVGWSHLPVRLNCRPEISMITIGR